MGSSYSDIGLVVKVVDHGEADKLVHIISEKHGLGIYHARGVRRPTSKKSPHLDLTNLIKFNVGRGDHPRFINQVESIAYYPGIKSDYHKVGLCLTILEIVTQAVPRDVEDPELFMSLKNFFEALDGLQGQRDSNILSRQFGLYLLRHFGFPAPKNPQISSLSTYFEAIINRKIISKDIK